MERLTSRRRRAGFTLVELMIAAIIFAMVIAGLAAIYATALSQSGRVLGESRLKSSAAVALRNITQTVMQANVITTPAAGAGGAQTLTVCANVLIDGAGNTINNVSNIALNTACYSFCIQPNATAACATAPCLFGYSAPPGSLGTWNFYPPPAVNAGNCGNTISGQTPFQLATDVVPSQDPNFPNYFYRDPVATNQVRVGFRFCKTGTANPPVCKPATAHDPPLFFDDGTTVAAQFDARL